MDGGKSNDVNVAHTKAEKKLALKRIRDRRSQQAMRDRQKREILSLREQVAQLSQIVRDAGLAGGFSHDKDSQVDDSQSEDQQPDDSRLSPRHALASPHTQASTLLDVCLGPDNLSLRHPLPSLHKYPAPHAAPYFALASPEASPAACPDSGVALSPRSSLRPSRPLHERKSACSTGSIVIEASVLKTWSERAEACAASPQSSALHNLDATYFSRVPFSLSDNPERLPSNIAQLTCPADRIMVPFIEKNRQLHISLQRARTPYDAESEAHYYCEVEKIKEAITNVTTDVLATYVGMQTLPKKIACLFSLTKILNWLVFQTKEAFENMPVWMRPCPAQLEIPHPAWIDRVRWPRAREYLVHHQEIKFDEFTTGFLSFDLNWVYSDEHTLLEKMDSGSTSARYTINPVFEEHIQNIGNWTVGRRFWQLYPGMAKGIEEDIRQFKSVSVDRQYWALLNS